MRASGSFSEQRRFALGFKRCRPSESPIIVGRILFLRGSPPPVEKQLGWKCSEHSAALRGRFSLSSSIWLHHSFSKVGSLGKLERRKIYSRILVKFRKIYCHGYLHQPLFTTNAAMQQKFYLKALSHKHNTYPHNLTQLKSILCNRFTCKLSCCQTIIMSMCQAHIYLSRYRLPLH